MSTEKSIIKKMDAEVKDLRKAGYTVPEIANRLQLTEEAVHTALSRELRMYSQRTPFATADYMTLMLERYEDMFREVWPLCHHRKVTDPAGGENAEEIILPPDQRMILVALKIMDKMNSMVGLTPSTVEALMSNMLRQQSHEAKATLAGSVGTDTSDQDEETAKNKTLELLNMLTDVGLLDSDGMLAVLKELDTDDNIDELEIEENDE